mgnify:CR=1 FL=1
MTTATATTVGKIVQIIGPVIDIAFESENLPEIYNAIEIKRTTDAGQPIRVTVEVQQHIGRNQVRAVAMSSTDGIVRGIARDVACALAVTDQPQHLGPAFVRLRQRAKSSHEKPSARHTGWFRNIRCP